MAERTILSISVPNILTVWLMLFLGLFIFALASQLLMKHGPSLAAAAGMGGGEDDGTG